MAAADDTFTMTPAPRGAMSRAARREHSSVPRRLTSTTRRSSAVSVVGEPAERAGRSPALFTRPVTAPSRSAAVSKSRSTSASSEVSARTVTHLAPGLAYGGTRSARRPRRRVRTRPPGRGPSAASRRQVAAPMPRLPPVTTVTGRDQTRPLCRPSLRWITVIHGRRGSPMLGAGPRMPSSRSPERAADRPRDRGSVRPYGARPVNIPARPLARTSPWPTLSR